MHVKNSSFFIGLLLLFLPHETSANPPGLPQRNIKIISNSIQELCFGDIAVYGSTSGMVSVNYDGMRTVVSGNAYLMDMGSSPQQAIVGFRLCPGRSVQITYSPTFSLSDNAAHTMNATLGPMRVGQYIISASGQRFTSNKGCDDIHMLYIGATLEVGNKDQNPTGSYIGSFEITLANE